MFSFPHNRSLPEVALRDATGLLTEAELALILENLTTNISSRKNGVLNPRKQVEDRLKNAGAEAWACVKKPASWKVVGLRFAPYELAVPGTKEPAIAWGKANGTDLAKVIQLRMSLTPYCIEEGSPKARDMSIHLVYELVPEDSAQRSAFLNAQTYAKAAVAGDSAGADKALKAHADYLSSPEYNSFRKEVLADYTEVASARSRDGIDAKLDAEYRTLLETLFTKRGKGFDTVVGGPPSKLITDITDPYLVSTNSLLRTGLKKFVEKYARRPLLRAISTMTGGDLGGEGPPWVFKSNSVTADGTIKPNIESTMFSSFAEGKSLRLVVSGMIDSFGAAYEAPGIDATVKAAFDSQRVSVNNKDFAIGGDEDNIDIAARDADYTKQYLRKTIDPDFSQPTSSDCMTCHLAVETNRLAADGKSLKQPIGGYNFHMLSLGKMNLRTLTEARLEAALLNSETGGYTVDPATGSR